MNRIPKIIRLEMRNPGIIIRCDNLLNQGLSLRKVAKQLRHEFDINLSYGSVKNYKDFKAHNEEKQTVTTEKKSFETLIHVGRIRKTRY